MMTLEEMKAVYIRTVEPDTLVDVRDVKSGIDIGYYCNDYLTHTGKEFSLKICVYL